MTDEQWALLEPLLPPPGNTGGRGGRPEKHPRRRVLDAIFYVVRGGIAWAALPVEFPPAKTVYGLFRRWVRSGAWARVAAGRSPLPTAAVIDSASVHGADTVPGASRGYDAGKKVNGRKRHLAVDTAGLLLAVVVTVAGIQDRDGACRLLAALRAKFSTIHHPDLGRRRLRRTAGHLGQNGARLHRHDRQAHRRPRRLPGHPPPLGGRTHPGLDQVERTLAWISKHRPCVRDYETLPEHHETMIQIAMIMIMSRRLARTQQL